MNDTSGDENTSKLTIAAFLESAYGIVLSGAPSIGIESAHELAKSYAKRGSSPITQAESLVRWQVGKAGVTGFATGLGGLLILPITLPANLATVICIQLRMVAAIAILGGHDPRDDQVKTMALFCLAGNAAKELAREFGIKFSVKLAEKAVQRISGKALIEINKKVGVRLFTKFGEKGLINFGKAIPLVGGFVGGGFDAVTTYGVGQAAIEVFIRKAHSPEKGRRA